ncbi:MAG: TerB family tellurite resistance protein [Bradymonadaceae bacterium]
MADFQSLWTQYTPPSSLKELNLEESAAVLDLLLAAVMIDHRVTDEELERLSTELEKLPFEDSDDLQEQLGAHAVETREKLEGLVEAGESLDSFVENAAGHLTNDEHRREALKMVAVVAYADGVDSTEEELTHKIGRAFGFDADEIERCLMVGSIDEIKNPR